MAMTKDRRTGSSLPFSATRDLADCRLVRWASRLPPLVDEGSGDELVVISMGQRHTYSGSRAALVALVEGKELTVEELLANSGLAPADLRSFLVNAVEEGTLICRM